MELHILETMLKLRAQSKYHVVTYILRHCAMKWDVYQESLRILGPKVLSVGQRCRVDPVESPGQ